MLYPGERKYAGKDRIYVVVRVKESELSGTVFDIFFGLYVSVLAMLTVFMDLPGFWEAKSAFFFFFKRRGFWSSF